jgi:hypothetical protein
MSDEKRCPIEVELENFRGCAAGRMGCSDVQELTIRRRADRNGRTGTGGQEWADRNRLLPKAAGADLFRLFSCLDRFLRGIKRVEAFSFGSLKQLGRGGDKDNLCALKHVAGGDGGGELKGIWPA